jgi:hypothetical protein
MYQPPKNEGNEMKANHRIEDDMFCMWRTSVVRPELLTRLRGAHVLTEEEEAVAEGEWALPPTWRQRCRAQISAIAETSPTWSEKNDMREGARSSWREAVTAFEAALSAAEDSREHNAKGRAARAEQQRATERDLMRLARLRRRADARADFARSDEIEVEIRALQLASDARHREEMACNNLLQQAEVSARMAFDRVVDALTRIIATDAA